MTTKAKISVFTHMCCYVSRSDDTWALTPYLALILAMKPDSSGSSLVASFVKSWLRVEGSAWVV